MLTPADTRIAITSVGDWETAVEWLLSKFIEANSPFTSGEFAAHIRYHRPDLRFSVAQIGQYLRENYENGTFPSYTRVNAVQTTLDTEENYPVQVGRVSAGYGRNLDGQEVYTRTPVGTPVFVYAPDQATGEAHPFEVYVPQPYGESHTGSDAPLATTPTPLPADKKAQAVLITGTLKRDDLTGTVRPDGRLCVPRAAFEAFVALSGTPLRGGPSGDPIYIHYEASGPALWITREPLAAVSSTKHYLWAERGRLAFKSADFDFIPGQTFEIEVDSEAIRIKL